LEVKGDLARKVSGSLGIKVEGDIVLESSRRISLKAGGSFIVIQAGGVDIVGPKINLNGGGSAGTPVGTLQSAVLAALSDDGTGENSGGGDDSNDSSNPVTESVDDEEKKITSISWSYGEDKIELGDISRHYVDLNLHIRTENYNPGETVCCEVVYTDLNNIENVLNVSGVADDSGNVIIDNVFSNIDIGVFW
ncbi:hypothetical protein ACVUCS_004442, partial [Salmonella enterica subsp. enterica]